MGGVRGWEGPWDKLTLYCELHIIAGATFQYHGGQFTNCDHVGFIGSQL